MWSDPAESTSLKSAFALSSWTVHTGCNVSPSEGEGAEEVVRDLDTACLLLCIALLDHTLQGDHFESVVLSFLAVLGIDENPGGVFRGPLTSTYLRALTEESPGCSFSRVTLCPCARVHLRYPWGPQWRWSWMRRIHFAGRGFLGCILFQPERLCSRMRSALLLQVLSFKQHTSLLLPMPVPITTTSAHGVKRSQVSFICAYILGS
jgi:hypothetical protein